MEIRFDDFKLLVKNDRRIWAAAGFISVALTFWLLTGNDQKPRQARRLTPDAAASRYGTTTGEITQDFIYAFSNSLEEVKKDRDHLRQTLVRSESDFANYKERSENVLVTMVDQMENLEHEVDQLAQYFKRIPDPPLTEKPKEPGTFDDLDKIIWPDEPIVAQQPLELPPRVSYIAPGDAAPGRLLTGVNAPVDGTPYPVVFELTGPITGPDGAILDLGSARVVAAAQGTSSDSRALFRLTQLAIRHPSGRRSVIEVDGWVLGEDGVRGLGGKLLDKLGRVIIATAAVSAASALGSRIEERGDTVVDRNGNPLSIGGSDVEAAGASAMTDAANRLGQEILDKYESQVSTVEILPNRNITIVFSKSVEVQLLDEKILLASRR